MVRALRARDVFLAAIAVGCTASTSFAQIPSAVRTVGPTPVVRWINASKSDLVVTLGPGATLDVLDKENDWYWIITPADDYGVRRGGWVATANVEAVERIRSRTQRDEARSLASASAGGATLAGAAPGGGDTASSSTTAVTSSGARDTSKDYGFEDVHFSFNQAALTAEQAQILDRAAAVLKDDPLLRVNVEGYTCNIGRPAYNLLLGDRRASTVRDYLVSKGVSADRLHTVSFGEQSPKYDNSSEETRRLNRRVAIVPNVQP